MLSRTSTVLIRTFTTKGSKRTKRLEAAKRELKRKTPPKLPWYLHKEAPKWFTNFVTNRKMMKELYESAELMYTLLKAEPVRIPIHDAITRLNRSRMVQERQKFEAKQLPKYMKKLRSEYEAITGRQVAPLAISNNEVFSSSGTKDVEFSFEDVADFKESSITAFLEADGSLTIGEADSMILSADDELLVDEILLRDRTSEGDLLDLDTDFKTAVLAMSSSESVPDFLERKSREMLAIDWSKALALRKSETAESLLFHMKEHDSTGSPIAADTGLRLVHALQRENRLGEAWDVFRDVTSKRNIWTPALIEAGINLCGMLGKPERALNYFEIGELKFGAAYLPLMYHPIMRACARSRGMTTYTFEMYDRMTKVSFYKPNEETLKIVLKACSTLGDVVRAKEMWSEMIDKYQVVPDEDCVVNMLRTYANGNRMLRAKTLKRKNVKVLTFQDKALLAQAAGFTPPKVDRTDEGMRVLRELDVEDPRSLRGNYTPLDPKLRRGIGDMNNDDLDEFDEDSDESVSRFDDDGLDENDPDVIAAKREFKEDYAAGDVEAELDEIRSTEHLKVVPGVSPIRPPEVNRGHYQKVFDSVKSLVTQAENRVVVSNDVTDSALEVSDKDESQPGRRQEANIIAAQDLVKEVESRIGLPASVKIRNAELAVLASALRLNRAELLAKSLIEDEKPDRITCSIMISMFCRAQRLDRAKEWFERAQGAGDVDKLTVGPLIDGLARAGKVKEALDLYKTHESVGILERHMRVLRNKVRGTPDESLVPEDPNFWRSHENISDQMRSLPRDGDGYKTLSWMTSQARG